ncbi:hypothetical protein PF006_g28946 [Phytophthora fragariae]|uniref:DDE Tnp4 domain-containing protein n=2 Tax=Phytophthora fragariae TaxID=53985 RepID=A0A6A3QAK6_9STRA|nr:hypothetical protein PF003_g23730 [Phytophthora fragariae]KAE9072377.1 hypothetical protein PF006_g28946 [Phytophthora fragariae]
MSLDRAARQQAQPAIVLSELLLTPSSPPKLILNPAKEAVALMTGSLGCAVDSVALRTRIFVPRSLQWRTFVFSSFAAPSEFRSHFRLTRAAFSELLAVLAPLIIKQESRFDKVGGRGGAGRLLTGLDEHYSIPFFLLADSAYANSKHVVTTFEIAETQRDVPTARLNRALAGMRYPVECAFGILKSRCRVLGKPVEMARTNVEAVPTLIAAVCILHNFAIDLGDGAWDVDAEADQRAFYFANFLTMTNDGQRFGACHTDTKTRDALLKWMRFRDSIRG